MYFARLVMELFFFWYGRSTPGWKVAEPMPQGFRIPRYFDIYNDGASTRFDRKGVGVVPAENIIIGWPDRLISDNGYLT